MTDSIEKIQLEFSEARKEIMALRQENRKLETAITLLSKPMVMSDSEDGPPSKRAHAEAIVVALPQGEAQERIDCFLAENSKLAAEIVQLRQMSRGGGIAEIYEKNKQLEAEVQERVKQITELESAHAAAIKTNQAKYEKELRVLRIERKYVDVHVYC